MLKKSFSLDLRSLALLRILIAILILADLINSSTHLELFYTDAGTLPRSVYLKYFANKWIWSFHLMHGQSFFITGLFVLAAIFAVGLLLGYKTRVMIILSWVFLVSLQNRNPYVLQGGDVLLRMLLFWMMFLPMGARFSLDRAMSANINPQKQDYFHVGSVALILQILFMYFFTAMLKQHPVWHDGQGVYYAMQLDVFATNLGLLLRNYPSAMMLMSYATLVFEMTIPILILSPFFQVPIRLICILVMINLHLGFILFMEIGLFPYICLAAWLVFLPAWFWDKVFAIVNPKKQIQNYTIYYDGECGFCKKMAYLLTTFLILKPKAILPAQSSDEIYQKMLKINSWILKTESGQMYSHYKGLVFVFSQSPIFYVLKPILNLKWSHKWGLKVYEFIAENRMLFGTVTRHLKWQDYQFKMSYFGQLLCVLFLSLVLFWNVKSLKVLPLDAIGAQLKPVSMMFKLVQNWNMFAPKPMTGDGWYIVKGHLKNKNTVPLFFKNQNLDGSKPKLVSAMFENQRVRKFMMTLKKKKYKKLRTDFAHDLCRDWNAKYKKDATLKTVEILFMYEKTVAPEFDAPNLPPKEQKLLRHDC